MADNDEDIDLSQYESPTTADTSNMSWGQYAAGTAANFPNSAGNVIKGAVSAINPVNWPSIGKGMYGLAEGTAYNLFGEPQYQTDQQKKIAIARGAYRPPEQVQAEEQVASEFAKNIPPVWTTDQDRWHQFGQRFYEDPAGVTSIMAAPISGGGGALAKAANIGSKAAETGSLVSKALDVAGKTGNVLEKAKYMDPTTAALGVTGSVAQKAIPAAASYMSNIPDFEPIKNLWSQTGPEAEALRDTFRKFASGSATDADYSNLMDQISNEVNSNYRAKVNEWAAKKGNLANVEVPLYGVLDEYKNALDKLGPRELATPDVQSAIDTIAGTTDASGNHVSGLMDQLQMRIDLPSGNRSKMLSSVDQYKQDIWNIIKANKKSNPSLANVLTPVHNELLGTLTTEGAPGKMGGDATYANLMKDFQDIQDFRENLETATGSNMNKVSQFRRILQSKKNPVGRTYLDEISQKNPQIGAALLGSSSPSNIIPSGVKPSDILFGGLGTAAAYLGHPYLAAGSMLGEGAKLALSSPGITTGVAKGLGAMERSPITSALKTAVGTIPLATRTASPFESNLDQAYNRLLEQAEQPQQADGGRIGHAFGGRAGKDPKARAMALINMVDRIKKEQGNETKPLLNLDDTTVAKALAIANRGI